MLRSDKLTIVDQDEIDDMAEAIGGLKDKLADALAEVQRAESNITTRENEVRAIMGGGGMDRMRKEREIHEFKGKKQAAEADVKDILAQMAPLAMWNNPEIVKYYYLTENEEKGFVRSVYISWFPGARGVGIGLKEMLRTMKGTPQEGADDDMVAEMSDETRDRLTRGVFKPRDGQVRVANTYGFKEEYHLDSGDDWGQEPDFVISLPAFGITNRYWGVNTVRMWEWYDDSTKHPDTTYKMISATSSCAGVALRALVAGGGETFAKLASSKYYVLPNEVAHYAIEVRAGIVDLNGKTARFEYRVLQPRRRSKPSTGPHSLDELWRAKDWRENRGSKAYTRFSVGDALEKQNDLPQRSS